MRRDDPAASDADPATWPGLPARRTSFVGRAAELAELGRLVAGPSPPRLLTPAGPGGCGKTRLALQLLARLPRAAVGETAAWVELAGLSAPEQVPQTVAEALRLREAPPRSLIETIAAALGDQPALLALDNCEHVLAGCAALLAELFAACPGLRVLATSREPLGLPGEQVWPVPPLSLPVADQPLTPESLAAFDAVQLFVERASHELPAFDLTDGNAAAVATVCRQVAGLPLALEMAAARVAVLRVEQIAARLDDQLRLLAGGGPAHAPRHQTLRATLAWSYDLLSEPERALFRRLAVFAGGWSLEAAEAVGAEPEALETLTQLMRKSLVVVEREPGRDARFRLLDAPRQFAYEHLVDAGESASAAGRHLAYFTQLAEAPRPHVGFFLPDADLARWMARLRPELDNLRAALAWSVQDPARGEAGLRLLSALHWFWFARGYFSEARDWLARLLRQAAPLEPATHARALTTLGWLACWQGAFPAAHEPLEAALRLYQEFIDPWGTAFTLHALGWAASALGDGPRGQRLIEECLAIARRQGDQWLISFAQHFLGIGAAFQGDHPAARAHFAECIRVMRQLGGSTAGLAFSHFHLGRMDRLEGQFASAANHFEEALRLFQSLNNRRGVAYVLSGVASLLAATDRPAPAVRLFAAVAALRTALGSFLEAPLQVEFDRDLAAARAALPAEAFAAAWVEGQALKVEALAAEGLAQLSAPAAVPAPPAAAAAEVAAPEREHDLRLLALGPAEVYRGADLLRPADWTFARPKHVLFYLLNYPARTREQLGLAFWPDASPAQLRNGLRSALYRLRQALGGSEWVVYQDECYHFNRTLSYWYDVEAFERVLAEAELLESTQPARAIERLQAAAALYRGDFLEDFPAAGWVDARRAALRQAYLQALLSLGRLQLAAGQLAEAAAVFQQAIARDSYLEAAHRGLMRTFARQGEPGQALRHYQGLAALLQDELGLPPAAETTALFERLRRGEVI